MKKKEKMTPLCYLNYHRRSKMCVISGNGEIYDDEEIFPTKFSTDYEDCDDDYCLSYLDETILLWERRNYRF